MPGRKGDTEGLLQENMSAGNGRARRPWTLGALDLRAGGDGGEALRWGSSWPSGAGGWGGSTCPRLPGQRGAWEGHCWLLGEPFQECGRT